jgi:hypothetical protein
MHARMGLLLAAAAAAALITGCGQSAPTPDPYSGAAATPAAPAAQQGPAAVATCRTVWLSGGGSLSSDGSVTNPRAFPDTPAGLRRAAAYSYRPGMSNTNVDGGVIVAFKAARPVTLTNLAVELDNPQGSIWSGSEDPEGQPHYFAAGEHASWTIDWVTGTGGEQDTPPSVSAHAYLQLRCVVPFWN